jgi:alpha-tubulin suppressor-like RCC1 family protein
MKIKTTLFFLVLLNTMVYGQCWQSITASGLQNNAIKTDGTLWGWGLIEGAGYTPMELDTNTDWQSISAGMGHSLAIKKNGTLWSWATDSGGIGNLYGQLGNGTNTNHITPTQVGSDFDWKYIAAGYAQTFAIKNNGTLWACGNNSQGQLGDGTLQDKNTLIQIGNHNNWLSIAHTSGSNFTIGLKTNGTLWGWGSNNVFQLGDGTTIDKIIPVQIGIDNDWQSVSTGSTHVIAIKNNGTLWAWGNNEYGQLGDGTTVNKKIPTQIGTQTNWKTVSAGQNFSIAIKSNGTIWSWGYNYLGQLGNGTAVYSNSKPNQIGIDENWQFAISGAYHTVAIKADNSIWSWGYNIHRQLGYKTGAQISSYVPALINCANLSIKDIIMNNRFFVYPNPAKDLIQIDDIRNKNIMQIKIIDTYGKIVLQQNKDFSHIKVQNLQSGIYIIQILSEDSKYDVKFVKE